MHDIHVNEASSTDLLRQTPGKHLDFLWLELTNRCNLQCVHCYTESHPHSGDRDLMTKDDYVSTMEQAYALGCRKLQFIGGEPQLNGDFYDLLVDAKGIGFDFIEVFSNLTLLADKTLRFAAQNGICFATSVYADDADAHDAVTGVSSSHQKTIRSLRKLVEEGIETRAAIIVLEQEQLVVERTKAFLKGLGVTHVQTGEARPFGRGKDVLARPAEMSGLCGHCWNARLCVAPDGQAYPCVMARQWPVGNVLQSPLAEIVRSDVLDDVRQTIFDDVWTPKVAAAIKKPSSKKPAGKKKKPGRSAERDLPKSGCMPCLQSCVPIDAATCGPLSCPQSCTPLVVICGPTKNK